MLADQRVEIDFERLPVDFTRLFRVVRGPFRRAANQARTDRDIGQPIDHHETACAGALAVVVQRHAGSQLDPAAADGIERQAGGLVMLERIDVDLIVGTESFYTHGAEVAPRSDVVGEDFEDNRIGHG